MKTVNIMKNYNVSKEFIIEAYAAACDEWKQKIEVQFPELFKHNVEPGKWYKFGNKYLLFIDHLYLNGEAHVYGFNKGVWYTSKGFAAIGGILKPKEATDREVELALTEEAVRRGFKNGVKVNRGNWYSGLSNSISIIDKSTYPAHEGFSFEDVILMLNGFILFQDGNWAEIVKEDRTHKVGDKIIIDDDDTYLICRVGTNTISLVSCAGESWDYTVQVVNENKITKKELNDHIGDYKWERV